MIIKKVVNNSTIQEKTERSAMVQPSSGLTLSQINELGKILENEKERIKKCLEAYNERFVSDVATEDLHSILPPMRQNHAFRVEELPEVEAALRKIPDGTYGICEGCGEGVSYERLLQFAWAKCCVRCQNKKEGCNKKRTI